MQRTEKSLIESEQINLPPSDTCTGGGHPPKDKDDNSQADDPSVFDRV